MPTKTKTAKKKTARVSSAKSPRNGTARGAKAQKERPDTPIKTASGVEIRPNRLVINYTPDGETIRDFLFCEDDVQGVRGPRGSGKSSGCCVKVLKKADDQRPSTRDGIRKSRWAVIRETYPELKTTTLKTWNDRVPQSYGRFVGGSPMIHHIKKDDLDLEMVFIALDRPEEVEKLLSFELTGAYINEARAVPKAVLDQLSLCVGRYPSMDEGGCEWSGIIMDSNSMDENHWWYKYAEEPGQCPEGWRFFSQPPAMFKKGNSYVINPDADNLKNLPERYYQKAIQGKTPEWINIYILNNYGFVLEGRPVYGSEYQDRLHCSINPLEPIPGVPLIIGVDLTGFDLAGVICQLTPKGQFRVLDEIVVEDFSVYNFCDAFNSLMARKYRDFNATCFLDPASVKRAPERRDKLSAFEIFRKNITFPVELAETNEFKARRDSVMFYLTQFVGGEPKLIISPTCAVLRRGFLGGYHFREMNVPGVETRYHPTAVKNIYSQPHDSLQYACLGAGVGVILRRQDNYQARLRTMPRTGGGMKKDPFKITL